MLHAMIFLAPVRAVYAHLPADFWARRSYAV